VALKILDDSMSSDRSPHTARLLPSGQSTWEVSWLPGHHLNRNQAITAMVIADTTVDSDVHPGHLSWPHIQGWAAELGMTGPQALDRVAGPPQRARQPDKTADLPIPHPSGTGLPAPDPPLFNWIEDPDPIDLGWTDSPDWPEPEWPGPGWPGCGPGRHPTYMFNLAVSPWYKEHYPDNSANLWDALRAGRDPQPHPEPDNPPDWEAGQ
jgi:hypothetical protein